MTNRLAHNLIARALERGGRGHRATRLWLSAIGVDPRDFGDQIPALLAFYPDCPWQNIGREQVTSPAIVVPITNPAGTVVGVLRRWLPHDWDEAAPEAFWGAGNLVDPWMLGEEPGLIRVPGRAGGPVVLTRSVEAALAVAAASPGTHAWAACCEGELGRGGWPEAVKRSVQLMVAAGKQAERLTLVLGDEEGVPAGIEAACFPVPLVVRRPENAGSKVTELAVGGKVSLVDLVRHGGAKMMRAVLGDLGGGFVGQMNGAARDRGEAASEDGWGPGGWNGGMAAWTAATRGEDPEHLAPPTPLERARRFLYEECRVPGQARFTLARAMGKWWEWNGAGKYEELPDERLRSRVWDYLDQFLTMKRGKAERLAPGEKAVKEVLSALAADTAVVSEQVPCWLPEVINADGLPLWGVASRIRARPAKSSTISFRNGLLDLAEVVKSGVVALATHTASLFATSELPFELDAELLRRLMVMEPGSDEFAAVFQELCPKFWLWLHSASEGDADPAAWRRQCQQMLGDTISGDRTLEKINLVVGVQRAGKGILEDAIGAIVGEEHVAAPPLDSFNDRFGLAPLVGKLAIVVPDATLGDFSEGGSVVAALKTISGNGRVQVRDLYSSAYYTKLQGRLWIFANEEPDLRDRSGAMADRFILLPMLKSNIGREDPSIKAAVPREAPGIMLWALLGAIDLARMERRAIVMSKSGQEWHGEMREQSVPIATFIKDCLEVGPEFQCDYNALKAVWDVWCIEEAGIKATGKKKMAKALKLNLPGYQRVQVTDAYSGRRVWKTKGFKIAREWLEKVEKPGTTYGMGSEPITTLPT